MYNKIIFISKKLYNMRNSRDWDRWYHDMDKGVIDKWLTLDWNQIKKLKIISQKEISELPLEDISEVDLYYKIINRISDQKVAINILNKIRGRIAKNSWLPPYRELICLIRDKNELMHFLDKTEKLPKYKIKKEIYEVIQDRIALINSNWADHIKKISVPAEENLKLSKKYVYWCRLTITWDKSKIKKLDLSDNYLWSPNDVFDSTLPDNLFEWMTELKILNLSDNYITVIPESILKLKKLEEIDLSWNYISFLPKWIKKLPNLKTVKIEDNYFYSSKSHLDIEDSGDTDENTEEDYIDQDIRIDTKNKKRRYYAATIALASMALWWILNHRTNDNDKENPWNKTEIKNEKNEIHVNETKDNETHNEYIIKKWDTLWDIYWKNSIKVWLDNKIKIYYKDNKWHKITINWYDEAQKLLKSWKILYADIKPWMHIKS